MNQNESFSENLLSSIHLLFNPILAIDSVSSADELFYKLGFSFQSADEILKHFSTINESCYELWKKILTIKAENKLQLSSILGIVKDARNLNQELDGLKGIIRSTFKDSSLTPDKIELIINQISERLFAYLFANYAKNQFPRLFGILVFLGAITKQQDKMVFIGPKAENIKEIEYYQINWSRIWQSLSSTNEWAKEVYNWSSDNVDFNYELLITNLKILSETFRIPANLYNQPLEIVPKISPNNLEEPLELRIPLAQGGEWPDSYWELGISIGSVEETDNDSHKGIIVSPYIVSDVSHEYKFSNSKFDIELELTGNLKLENGIAATIRPLKTTEILNNLLGTNVLEHALSSRASLLFKQNSEGEVLLFGSPTATRLSLDNLQFEVFCSSDKDFDFGIKSSIGALSLYIIPSDGDGLIKNIFPNSPLQLTTSLSITLSKNKGLSIDGSIEFDKVFLINQTLGPISISTLTISLKSSFGENKNLEIAASISASIVFGPVIIAIKNIGISSKLDYSKRGTLGSGDFSFGFKFPEGIGLSISSDIVKGGGYLSVNDGNYSGAFELTVQNRIAIQVVAVIITKMPDGSETFSFKLFGCAEFPPIQLGMGFSLSGLGMAIAINCCMCEEALKSAVYGGSLRSLLFPPDVIANAPKIINDLNSFFPPHDDFYVIGAMAQLAWGPGEPIIFADVGIFIEIGKSIRIALAGTAHADLPNNKNTILHLEMNVVGLIDLKAKTLSIDSSLSGSKIMDWTLDGTVAIRARWDDNPRFIMSAGGFFPGYNPPPGFPSMRKMSVVIGAGNPYIGLFSYFAIAENSCQLGAALVFSWKKSYNVLIGDVDVEVKGMASFDALFRFNPFYFDAILRACFGIKVNGEELASIDLRLEISGPNPYHVVGYGKIGICGIDVEVKVDRCYGLKKPEIEIQTIDPIAILTIELNEPKNWSFQEISNDPQGVIWVPDDPLAIKDTTTDAPINPTGLKVCFNQKHIPLDVTLDMIGSCPLAHPEENKFNIEVSYKMADGKTVVGEPVYEKFAPGQFKNMTDDEKIKSPSFENYKSGVEFISSGDYEMAKDNNSLVINKCDIGYDTTFVDCSFISDLAANVNDKRQTPPIFVNSNSILNEITSVGRCMYTHRPRMIKSKLMSIIG